MHSKLEEEMIELSLDSQINKTEDIWHICVEVVSLILFLIKLSILPCSTVYSQQIHHKGGTQRSAERA